jgi:hypothetical protein
MGHGYAGAGALGAVLLLLTAACAPHGAAAIGTAWACASQPGPFQVWLQELHLTTGSTTEDQVEVAALAAVNTTWARVDGVCWLGCGAWVAACGACVCGEVTRPT